MFCSGAILQTFLLQAGFSEHQVYLYNSLIQLLQVATMIAMVFLSDRIGRVKTVVAFTGLSLVATATVFIIGAFNPALFGDAYVERCGDCARIRARFKQPGAVIAFFEK